ncbi:hypothetical protein G6M78_15580 [Agrobacterium tumefaciens]|uniref:hypothetical protein n=1 Tax=Agrobacterium tumefaciens TaxID=358 RepID=UPI0015745506|nr:hypothetical protein [Agrobacterium tumefaciens]MCZ7497282.1 hypothetical protein [Rhizobium rhizogenes]NTE56498.1 hypothetical protein [Agrobacterium tumefaciens]NTE74466.1 hypothetical protein [Agrobacterium tumefaciens]
MPQVISFPIRREVKMMDGGADVTQETTDEELLALFDEERQKLVIAANYLEGLYARLSHQFGHSLQLSLSNEPATRVHAREIAVGADEE